VSKNKVGADRGLPFFFHNKSCASSWADHGLPLREYKDRNYIGRINYAALGLSEGFWGCVAF